MYFENADKIFIALVDICITFLLVREVIAFDSRWVFGNGRWRLRYYSDEPNTRFAKWAFNGPETCIDLEFKAKYFIFKYARTARGETTSKICQCPRTQRKLSYMHTLELNFMESIEPLLNLRHMMDTQIMKAGTRDIQASICYFKRRGRKIFAHFLVHYLIVLFRVTEIGHNKEHRVWTIW